MNKMDKNTNKVGGLVMSLRGEAMPPWPPTPRTLHLRGTPTRMILALQKKRSRNTRFWSQFTSECDTHST